MVFISLVSSARLVESSVTQQQKRLSGFSWRPCKTFRVVGEVTSERQENSKFCGKRRVVSTHNGEGRDC